MIIDSHTHLDIKGTVLHGAPIDAQRLVASMKEAGIDMSLVIAIDFIDDSTSTDTLIRECSLYKQLKVVGSIMSKLDIGKQIEKLSSYIVSNKIVGIKIFPGYEDMYPHDEALSPLYTLCQKAKVPVIFHTGILFSGIGGLLKQTHPLAIDEVAYAFPDLTIVMAHVGNPWIVDCAAVVLKNKNVYTDLSGFFTEQKHITQYDVNLFKKKMREFADFAEGYSKCLFGTDYPLYNQKEYLEAVQQLEMSKEEQELVFWKNAATLFTLDIKKTT